MQEPSRRPLHIGDVADRTGLSLRTIRYYEEVGLLPPAERTPGGFRLYTDDAVERLLVIRAMKPLGFSLDEMSDLLEVLEPADAPAPAESLRRLHEYAGLVASRAATIRRTLEQAEELHRTLLARSSPDPTARP